MQPEALKFLHDIRAACDLIEQFIRGKSFDEYLNDALLRSAVERQLTIVGEALSQALKLEPELERAISDSRRIINFRHVLVHDYALIEHSTVWSVLEKRLPTLRREVDALLAAEASDQP